MSDLALSGSTAIGDAVAIGIGRLAPEPKKQDLTADNEFARYQSSDVQQFDGVSRAKRSTVETTDVVLHVPSNMDDFNSDIKRQLDAVVEKTKGMDVSKIEIIGYAPFFREVGLPRAEAVRNYFVDKGVRDGLIYPRGRGNSDPISWQHGVKITITGTPRVHPVSTLAITAMQPLPVAPGNAVQSNRLTDKRDLIAEIHQVPLDRRDFDSSIRQQLDPILDQLKNRKISRFEIIGYSSTSAQDADSRAGAVKEYFLRKGVDAKQMTVEGRHNSYPLAQKEAVKLDIESWSRGGVERQ